MRTTIHLEAQQEAELRRLAAERGDRGCSRVVAEAVGRYLAEREALLAPPPPAPPAPPEPSRLRRMQELLAALGRESVEGLGAFARGLRREPRVHLASAARLVLGRLRRSPA
jgi:hypothetical protein